MNKEVYIVGGGHSVTRKQLNKIAYKDTIAVNKSIMYVPNCNYFVTMDFSFLRKLKLNIKNTSFSKFFIANLYKPYLIEEKGQIIDKRYNLIYDLKDFDVIIKSRKVGNLSTNWKDFRNGDNSGYCALQLSILMGYKEINLLGIDLNVDEYTHFHKGYGEPKDKFQNKLDSYYRTFHHALYNFQLKHKDIKIYSCSKTSRLNEIIPYKEL